jgi:hypothetical protein
MRLQLLLKVEPMVSYKILNLTFLSGVTEECRCALNNFVGEGASCSSVKHGWLICMLSSPPVIVAASAGTQDAASDLQLLRSCLPLGLAVVGCWKLDEGDDALAFCSRMWNTSRASGDGKHLTISATGELKPAVPLMPRPESLLLSISFCLSTVTGTSLQSSASFRALIEIFSKAVIVASFLIYSH